MRVIRKDTARVSSGGATSAMTREGDVATKMAMKMQGLAAGSKEEETMDFNNNE